MIEEDLMIGDIVFTTEEYKKYAETDYAQVPVPCERKLLRLETAEDLWLAESFEPVLFEEKYVLDIGWKKRIPTDEYERQYLKAEYTSPDGTIIIQEGLTNDGCKWGIHVDNSDFDTVGTGEFDYLHELQHILKCCKRKDIANSFKCNVDN